MIRALLRQYCPMATALLSRLALSHTAPRFLPGANGGYALEQVVAWERLPSGGIEITLAVDTVHTSRSRVIRARLLSPSDALIFLAAIDEVTGDHQILATITAERDAALKRCSVLEAAIEALHDQRTGEPEVIF